MSVSCSPSQATETDNVQRNSEDIYKKGKYHEELGTDRPGTCSTYWYTLRGAVFGIPLGTGSKILKIRVVAEVRR